ncbi:MAG: hypothetical protein IKV03_03345 [Alphaproteobacteria bacterium]|nr:hypothetical protein [Alphaproteobacteria bacterium]
MSKKTNKKIISQTIDLEDIEDTVSTAEEAISIVNKKGKYEGYLPLVESEQEAKKFMRDLLADDARLAGADALVRGAEIKKQYNQMKKMAFSLSALAVAATGMAGYAVYEKSVDSDKYEAMLQQAVQVMPTQETAVAHCIYASSISEVMKRHPNKGIVEATGEVVEQLARSNIDVAVPIRHVVGRDLMALAKAYEDMGAPRNIYLNVMNGYAKGRKGDYNALERSEEKVKGNVIQYMLETGPKR